MSASRSTIDWDAAYARLERARRALEAGEEFSPEESRRLLERRAEALARPREEEPADAETLELLVFSLAGERYGVEVEQVVEVAPLGTLTAVPCTPAFVLGIVNHRGRVISVLDLRRLLGATGDGAAEGHLVVAVETGAGTFGVLAEATEIVRVGIEEVVAASPTLGGTQSALVRGVTEELITVLDLDALASDPRFGVEDERG